MVSSASGARFWVDLPDEGELVAPTETVGALGYA